MHLPIFAVFARTVRRLCGLNGLGMNALEREVEEPLTQLSGGDLAGL